MRWQRERASAEITDALNSIDVRPSEWTENWAALAGVKSDEDGVTVGGFHRELLFMTGLVSAAEISSLIRDDTEGVHYFDITELADDISGSDNREKK